MKLPKELTTITPLSKILAAILFISVPFIGFFLGIRYQEMIDLANRQQTESNLAITRAPTPTPLAMPTTDPQLTANWKTLNSTDNLFTINYPNSWNVSSSVASDHIDYLFSSNAFIQEGAYDNIKQKPTTYREELARIEKIAISSKTITIDGRSEKEYVAKMTSIYYGGIIFLKGKTDRDAIYINMTFYNPNDQKTFDQILSTFKFTGQ